MRVGFRTFAVVVVCSAIATALLLGSLKHSNAQTKSRYLPEYTATGELILPKNFHEWVYVGSPRRILGRPSGDVFAPGLPSVSLCAPLNSPSPRMAL